jgi:predicted alpha/beta-hydrolase family hydrolase
VKTIAGQELRIEVENAASVSALLLSPPDAGACFVFAHGAGAGMTHRFMEMIASGLYERGIATLRYQFPYMERGGRRPDAPGVAHAAVRAAVAEASRRCPGLPLFAGGKSFGGRMTSQAQAIAPLPHIRGLVFLGFPLHPLGKPSADRARHLSSILVPMLFVQGSRDKLAELRLLEPLVNGLAAPVSLLVIEQADHAFHVPARSGRNDGEVLAEILDGLSAWIGATVR